MQKIIPPLNRSIAVGNRPVRAGRLSGGINPVDIFFMQEALKEARRGLGRVHPNPLVGAVLVKNGKIIAKGAHEFFGGPHAEVQAIRRAGKKANGATLYSTLEPCTHFGKTAPCTSLILKKGVRRVVIGCSDINPDVSGKGASFLRQRKVKVIQNVLKDEAIRLNQSFFYWSKHKIPYVIIKAAQSLDGKIATRLNEAKWITGEKARDFVQRLRSESDAILVGMNTVMRDNPRLTVRTKGYRGEQPYKIILDSRLRISLSRRLFKKTPSNKIIIATTSKSKASKRKELSKKSIVILTKEKNNRVDLEDLLKKLGRLGITQILVEGGGEVIADFLDKKMVQECYFFVAPFIIGGKDAISSVGGRGIQALAKAYRFKRMNMQKVGQDLLIHGEF